MKNIIVAGICIFSMNVFSSQMTNIKKLTNNEMESAQILLNKMDIVSHSTIKKILILKGTGNTEQENREKTMAQALHGVCRFFDDGVNISINSKNEKGVFDAVNEFTQSSNIQRGDSEYNEMVQIISKVNKIEALEVYSGSASGNNTLGTVLGFYDVANNEIAVFASTNCGSDD